MTGNGVFRLRDMFSPDVQAGLPDGRYVVAVPLHFEGGLLFRMRAAWQVVTGRAVAFEWPQSGDLENCFRKPAPEPQP